MPAAFHYAVVALLDLQPPERSPAQVGRLWIFGNQPFPAVLENLSPRPQALIG